MMGLWVYRLMAYVAGFCNGEQEDEKVRKREDEKAKAVVSFSRSPVFVV